MTLVANSCQTIVTATSTLAGILYFSYSDNYAYKTNEEVMTIYIQQFQ